MSLEIRYYDMPDRVADSMQVTGDGKALPFLTWGGEDIPYATLEPGVWVLDGSRALLPEEPELWQSDQVSEADGTFSVPPVVECEMETPCTATGLTLTFSPSTAQWCPRVQVLWFHDTVLLAQLEAEIQTPQVVLSHTVENFNRLRLTLLSTNQPFHMAKLQHLQIGQEISFGGQSLCRVELVNELDPSLCVLSVDTMEVEIYDQQGRSLTPQKNQKMELYRNGSLLAVQYIRESRRLSRQTYRFSCQSAIGLLEDQFLGGIYENTPVTALLDEILQGHSYRLDPRLSGETISGFLPVCTRREALQQLSFAIGGGVTTQAGADIRISPLEERVSTRFLPEHIFAGSQVQSLPRQGVVEVSAHRYVRAGETETVVEDQTVNGTMRITFSQPYYDYQVTGGTLLDHGANYVHLQGQGRVTVKAKPYLHTVQVYTRRDEMASTLEKGSVLQVQQATLVTESNAEQVLERLYAVSRLRQELQQEVVLQTQQAGELAACPDPWNTQLVGYITAVEGMLTPGGHRAVVTVRGAQSPMQIACLYAGELFSGDEEVVCL